jgi:hypothetical protein
VGVVRPDVHRSASDWQVPLAISNYNIGTSGRFRHSAIAWYAPKATAYLI